ncbi:MAG: hypothetical protein LBP72_10445 [Dysgonamonadaceae bacterium]|jgi:hypothetical protein|nr:hypothetical protein [Dysgonamonadaceae bacterium]
MPLRKLPDTDKERIEILQAIIDQEELNGFNHIFTLGEVQELRNFLLAFEGAGFCFGQSLDDEGKACKMHGELFKNVQLYISHFIQVLYFSVIRNEIKAENLALYGLDGNNLQTPDLSTETAILEWGERLIKGETERVYRGGIPIYNPAIAKVKVHFDLFKDSLHSVKIYKQNTIRNRESILTNREKADRIIADAWQRVEDKYRTFPIEERSRIYKNYKISYQYVKGIQLNVFD